MPELPDVDVYVERIDALFGQQPLVGLRLASPFVLRSVGVAPATLVGRKLVSVERLGKRIILGFEGDYFAVVHLMIAGRFQWKDEAKAKIPGKLGLLAFDFASKDGKQGTLLLTEASTKKRASLHLVRGEEALKAFDQRTGPNAKAWFLTIVRNCCMDMLRTMRHHRRSDPYDEEALALTTDDRLDSPEAAAARASEARWLRGVIDELPTEYREVLILRELEDLSYKEISAIVRVPIGTVMSRLARAREGLAGKLGARRARGPG